MDAFYKLKQIPEDFIVEEIFNPELMGGEYLYVKLKKKGVDSFSALNLISHKLNIKHNEIGIAGSKDKNAVTTQIISLKRVNEARVANLDINNMKLEVFGRSEKPISLGDHEGNKFTITIRQLDDYQEIANKICKKNKINFINYFGEQRFGQNNIKIGLAIMKGDLEKACTLIKDSNVEEHLSERPHDYVGALRGLPKRRLTMYIHSVQSHIWNILAEKFKDYDMIPISGYMVEYPCEEMRDFVEKYLAEFGLVSRDFIIRKIPNLFTGGGEREREVCASKMKILDKGNDELNEGKKKIVISFELPKGSYATVFV